jgi:hypothetical protein
MIAVSLAMKRRGTSQHFIMYGTHTAIGSRAATVVSHP